MAEDGHISTLPAEMREKLEEVRARRRRIQLQTGLLIGVAMLLAGMLAAMAVDWLVVLRSPESRWFFTLAALGCGLAGLFRWGLLPLLRPPSLDALAREVDRLHPFLQERYLTLSEFAHNSDAPEIRGSPAMINRVAQQAAGLSARVQPQSVVSRGSLIFGAKCLAALAVLLVILFALDFQRAAVLCERFWLPGADITLTKLNARSGDVLIGKGESVTLEIETSGKPASSATIHLRSERGRNDEVAMRRGSPPEASFVYTQNGVTESFQYQARAGDGQTAWHRVTVVDRPKITQVKLRIVAPAYSHLPLVEEATLPHMVRALEGSAMELSIQPDQPLKSLVLQLVNGNSIPLTESPDHNYRFSTVLSNSFTFQPVLTNPREMENLDKPECEVVVYPDEPPTVRVLSPNDQVTAGSSEKVPINIEARDDFGIAGAEIDVSIRTESNTIEKVIPIPLQAAEQGSKLVRKQVELDLSQFKLEQGQELTYSVKVTDTKNNPAQSGGASPNERNNNSLAQNGANSGSTNSGAGERGDAGQNTNGPGQLASLNPPNQNQAQSGRNTGANQRGNQGNPRNNGGNSPANPGQNPNGESNPQQPGENTGGNQNQPGSEAQNQNGSQNGGQEQANSNQNQTPGQQNQNQNQNQNGSTNQNPSLAQGSQSTNSQSQQSSGGSQPPPDNMTRRSLPGGQTASSRQQSIKVDDWGEGFAGQQRQKQEIAIDAVIKQLDELLAKAQDGTDATLTNRRAVAKMGDAATASLASAQDNLRQADTNVDDLRAKSDGTPYAFVGLQMRDIRDTHIAPARDELVAVTGEAARQTNDISNLEQASYHIIAARKALADLTKTYEEAKRDNRLEEATQHIAKMHQIFIEDMQALMGGHRGQINTQSRKMAEVSDDFADKLKQLLEEQKKLMDELAKALAQDPRMLRRFLAMQQQDSVTLRDQLTLQARREQQLALATAAWTNTPATNRPGFLKDQMSQQASEQLEITELAMKLRENMFTWWPLEAPTNREDFVTNLALASDAARLSGEAISQKNLADSLASAGQALDKLRALYDGLPQMLTNDPGYTNFASYVANRTQEAGELITRQSGWIKKMQSLQAGDFAQAMEVDQHRLTVDSTTLEEKLEAQSVPLRRVSAPVAELVDQLMVTLHLGVLSEELDTEDALTQPDVNEAAERQASATNGFARAEDEFDEILRLLAAQQDQAPPPSGVGQSPTLEQMLTMLLNEQKLREQLGLSGRPINVQITRDWMNPNSQQSGGQSAASASAARQQGMAAQGQANNIRQQAGNQRQRGRFNPSRGRNPPGRGRAQTDPNPDGEGTPGEAAGGGPSAPPESWNTLVSKLGDEIRQGRDNVPPEQYREAIEHYFERISETLPIEAAPSPAPTQAPP